MSHGGACCPSVWHISSPWEVHREPEEGRLGLRGTGVGAQNSWQRPGQRKGRGKGKQALHSQKTSIQIAAAGRWLWACPECASLYLSSSLGPAIPGFAWLWLTECRCGWTSPRALIFGPLPKGSKGS